MRKKVLLPRGLSFKLTRFYFILISFSRFRKTFQVLHLLSQEEATWKLVHHLFKDRLETGMRSEMMMDVDADAGGPVVMGMQRDRLIADTLIQKDSTLRESQVCTVM